MMVTSWVLVLLTSSWQVCAAPDDPCGQSYMVCCSKLPEETMEVSREINDTSEVSSNRSSSCRLIKELKSENYICKTIILSESYTIVSGKRIRGKMHLTLNDTKNRHTECKCDHLCEEETISCGECTRNKAKEDSSWFQATFGIVIGAIVVGVGVVFIVICRKRIKRSRGRQNDASQRRCEEEKAFQERLQYILAKELDSISGAYSVPNDQMEVRRNYRPLRHSVKAAQDFQLHPFGDDNNDETYTEIIELDTKCGSRRPTHHDAILNQACDVTPPFLETGCSQGGDTDRECYNKLGCHGNVDKLTDRMPAVKENDGRLHCPTQARLCGGYNRTKTATDMHIKIEGEPAHDDTLPDTSICYKSCASHTSADHNPYDNSLHDLPLPK